MRDNQCSYLEGFIIMQFQNTTWVPEMAHPIENTLGSSTSQWETDILAKLLDERSYNNNVASAVLRHSDKDRVTLSGAPALSLSHEMLPALPLGPVSASLAERQPIWALHQFLEPLRQPLDSLCLTHWPSLALPSSWLPLRGI